MANRLNHRCKVCQKIFEEAKLRPDQPVERASQLYKMIRQSQVGRIDAADVARAYPELRYQAVLTHRKRHQGVTEKTLVKAKVEIEQKKIEKEVQKKVLTHNERRAAALEKLHEMLDAGDLKGGTFSAMAALLKQEADIEERQKDRTLEMQKLLSSYVANPLPVPSRGYDLEGEVVEPKQLDAA